MTISKILNEKPGERLKKSLLIFLFLSLSFATFAFDFGFKAGLGSARFSGPDALYDIYYQLDQMDTGVLNKSEFVLLSSDSQKSGPVYEAGGFVTFNLLKGVENVQVQPELSWQRFFSSFLFKNQTLSTDNLEIMISHSDSLSGQIDKKVHYLSLPLLLKLNQNIADELKNSMYDVSIYIGPAFSIKMGESITYKGGINSIADMIDQYVDDSQSGADPNVYYQQKKIANGADKFGNSKVDLIIGTSFSLCDIFKIGNYKEILTIDGRLSFGMNNLGKAEINNKIKMKSLVVTVGMKF